jgi:hypothetical protein
VFPIWRYLWASPATVLGVLWAALALPRGRVQLADGVLEAWGPLIDWTLRRLVPLPGGALAVTLGHVVIGRDRAALAATRAHERVHVRQYERWGPFFLPAYALSSLLAAALGGHPYHDNWFEREAARAAAGPEPASALLPTGRRADKRER